MKETQLILQEAKAAVRLLNGLTTEKKNEAMEKMAAALIRHTEHILAENAVDMEKAQGVIAPVMLDRLLLTKERIEGMAQGILDVAKLSDPVGEILSETVRPNGLKIQKVSVPLGVVAIIYESRPNVTSDAAALALKSGNVCVLRGGKEAFRSAYAIVQALRDGLKEAGLPETAINLVEDTTRQSSMDLMRAVGYVDLLIPRGGAGLINACVQNALVPCIHTGTGICHVYVDKDADLDMALSIVENAKMSRPSVCNAAEVLLVHEAVAADFLPKLEQLLTAEGRKQTCAFRVCEKAAKYMHGTPAGEQDFDTEFLNYILAVRVVSSVEEAVDHIDAHSTHHSEAIITENAKTAAIFTGAVDSAAVYVNASTRFTDGGEFGLGCELGISTQKMHARGPMGLKEMTAYKYVITGNGQVR
ncbi:MAG: glutamate-5-semialdehyde dehydrogenase [Clostridia bacterium]|nr:glutamate-5-semialdehyde dehydrogenase [Clostridia bacterium]MBR6752589.1 glutamate-5-semialdehyde dehydrogenase [Clostridia bacterium]